MKTSIIVPACNEEESLPDAIYALRRHTQAAIIVVNAGSRDKTLAVGRELGVNALSLPFNLGIGGVMQAGYRYREQQGYDAAIQSGCCSGSRCRMTNRTGSAA